MAHIGKIIFVAIIVFLAYISYAPVADFDPQHNIPNVNLAYDEHIVDQEFVKKMKSFRHPQMFSLEDLDVDKSGKIYSGLTNGSLVTIENNELKVIAHGKGIILGIKLSEDEQDLYFVDLRAGMCRLNLLTKEIEVLTNGYRGVPFNFIDNFDIAADGKIYITDASIKYPQDNYFMDLFEGKPHGRIYVYDPQTKATELLLENLYFPNGIQVSPDQQTLYFVETTAARISRHHLAGQNAGKTEVFLEGLPGLPDNMKFNSKGQLWVATPSFRDFISDTLISLLPVKRILARMPKYIHHKLVNTREVGGLLIDLHKQPRLQKILRSEDVSKVKFVTTILEKRGKLYFGSLIDNAFGILDLEEPSEQVVNATSQEL